MAESEEATEEAATQLHELTGLIPDEVGAVLSSYAVQVPADEAIVEIGSFKGKSTCYLAQGEAHVYAIDPWDLPGNPTGRFGYADAYPAFRAQVEAMGLGDRITPMRQFGHLAAKRWVGPVGLLFVDGDHSARAVERDVLAWLPHLTGTIILDDLDTPRNPGVRIAAKRLSKMLGPFSVEAERLAIWRL